MRGNETGTLPKWTKTTGRTTTTTRSKPSSRQEKRERRPSSNDDVDVHSRTTYTGMDREIVEEFISVTMDPKHYSSWSAAAATKSSQERARARACVYIIRVRCVIRTCWNCIIFYCNNYIESYQLYNSPFHNGFKKKKKIRILLSSGVTGYIRRGDDRWTRSHHGPSAHTLQLLLISINFII